MKWRILNQPSPVRRVRTNAGPTMLPLWEAPEEFFERMPCEELEDRAAQIAEDEDLKTRIANSYLETRAQYPEPTHVEEMLYTKSLSWDDMAHFSSFHTASWCEKLAIAENFEDDRLSELALRINYFECRSSLPAETVQKTDINLAHRLMFSDAKPLSIERALRQVNEERLRSKIAPNSIALLAGYATFLEKRRSKVLKFLEGE